jgi:hypothetical protein
MLGTPTPPPASPSEVAAAQAREQLDAKYADAKWLEKFHAGDILARREFGKLTATIAGYGGNVEPFEPAEDDLPPVAVTSGPTALTPRRLQNVVGELFAAGLDERSVEQIVDGERVTAKEYEAALQTRERLRNDPEWIRRLFAGGHEERRQHLLLSAILSADIKD